MFLGIAVAPVASDTLIYLQRTGDIELLYNDSIIEQGSGYFITIESEEEYNECTLDDTYSVLNWKHVRKTADTEILFTRESGRIIAEGIFEGEPFSKKYKIGDSPWYQFHELNMTDFGISDDNSRSFWTIDRMNMDIVKFKAEKLGQEMVLVNGRSWQAEKIQLSLTGLAGVLGWHSWFWLRSSDGRYLKLDAPGFLNSDEDSIVELISEG